MARRKTTINHAFAAAVAPSDIFNADLVKEAMTVLGQDPDRLCCAYCGTPAQTWDHVFATVKNSVFSGFGHRLGNLLPCCKACNSAKGNKDWRKFFADRGHLEDSDRINRIEAYLLKFTISDRLPAQSPEYARLIKIKAEVLALLSEADQLAQQVRDASSLERSTQLNQQLECQVMK